MLDYNKKDSKNAIQISNELEELKWQLPTL